MNDFFGNILQNRFRLLLHLAITPLRRCCPT